MNVLMHLITVPKTQPVTIQLEVTTVPVTPVLSVMANRAEMLTSVNVKHLSVCKMLTVLILLAVIHANVEMDSNSMGLNVSMSTNVVVTMSVVTWTVPIHQDHLNVSVQKDQSETVKLV
jgi:hypothetical protein